MLSTLLTIALSTSFVSAHYELLYPPTRGFEADIETQFCGGFPEVTTRTPYPLENATLSVDSHHGSSTLSVLISFESSPTSFTQFSNGTSLPYIHDFVTISQGTTCLPINIAASLSNRTIANGTIATIQTRYDGGDGDLFQCSDVILVTGLSIPSNQTCTSVNAAASSASISAASASSTSAASTASAAPAAESASGNTSDGKVTRHAALLVLSVLASSLVFTLSM